MSAPVPDVSQLPRYFVSFFDTDGPLLDVTVALPCPDAALEAASEVVVERLGYVPAASVHTIH
jgi:hypothetical protein